MAPVPRSGLGPPTQELSLAPLEAYLGPYRAPDPAATNPIPEPPSPPAILTWAQVRDLVDDYAWDVDIAMAVAFCESGYFDPAGNRLFDVDAVSETHDWGIFQMNQRWHAWRVDGELELFLIPEINVAKAYDAYVDGGGWWPWTCSRLVTLGPPARFYDWAA